MSDDEIVTAVVLELGAEFPHQERYHDFHADRTVVYMALKKYTTPMEPSENLLSACLSALRGPGHEYH